MRLTVLPENIPIELRQIAAWAVWKYETDERGHESKPPYQANNIEARAYATHPDTWASFEQAWGIYAASGGWFDGISFAISEDNGIVGIDLDHVSEHEPDALAITSALDSYTELSPSGDGLRIFLRGYLPPGRRVREWLEFYNDKRFLTVTGHRLPNLPPTIQARQEALDVVYQNFVVYG